MNKKRRFIGVIVIGVVATSGLVGLIIWNVSHSSSQPAVGGSAEPQSTGDLTQSALAAAQVRTQIKTDLLRSAAALTEYVSNNNGSYPTTQAGVDDLVKDYIISQGDFTSPLTNQGYKVMLTATTEKGTINILRGMCNSSYDGVVPAASTRQYSLLTVMADDTVYCLSL
jgi:hypothetical protein